MPRLPNWSVKDRLVQVALPGDHGVDTVAHHRAHAHVEQPLANDVLARAIRLIRRVDRRDEVAAQQGGERPRVDLVGLDLRLGDQPRLVRVREHHVLDAVEFAEFVVDPAPVPARLDHDLAGFGEALEVGGKRRHLVVNDAGLADASADGVHGGRHGVFLVVVDSSVEHSVAKVARMPCLGWLSCHLTRMALR
jgi:hypothetical protein